MYVEAHFGHFENECAHVVVCLRHGGRTYPYFSSVEKRMRFIASLLTISRNENGTIQGNLSSLLQFYDFLSTVEGDCACVRGFVCV